MLGIIVLPFKPGKELGITGLKEVGDGTEDVYSAPL
jgi:hypothetical protein